MKHFLKTALVVATLCLGWASQAQAQTVAYVTGNDGPPWGESTNEAAMDMVYGAGNWQDLRFETLNALDLLSATTSFIFMDGSDSTSDELEAFLTTNQTALENWVFNGGNLLLNAAPNEGDGMSFGFGGVLLNFDGSYGTASSLVGPADPGHPIFNGPYTPVGTDYTGNFFSHADIIGGSTSPIIVGQDNGGLVALSETGWGSGWVLFGGLTTDNFHQPQPEAHNLRANMIAYTAGDHGAVVPEPGSLALFLPGLAAFGFAARRRKKTSA